MINVLFVAHDAQLYGAQLSLLDILKNLDRTRFSPIVVAPLSGPFTEQVRNLEIPVITGCVGRWVLPRKSVPVPAMLRRPWLLARTPILCAHFLIGFPLRLYRLITLLKRNSIHVVYTNTVTVIDGAIAARLSSRAHIWHLREQIQGNREVFSVLSARWVTRIVLALSALVAVNSRALQSWVFAGMALGSKVKVIYNGIDPDKFGTDCSDAVLRSEFGLSPDTPVIAICGFIQERKGHETFLKAAALVNELHPEAHFVIIGGGSLPYVEFIKNLGDHLGLQHRLHFTGWRDDVAKIFCDIDMLVVASEQEPFGRTVIEGMSAGRPVIATRSGGPEEIVVAGRTGYLVDVGDYEEMAHKIVWLIENKARAHEFGHAGRERVLENFTQQAMVRQVEELIVRAVAIASNAD